LSRADRALQVLDTYILKPGRAKKWNTRAYKLLIELANGLIGDEIEMIHNKVCPFCGRKFTKVGIILHLRRTKYRLGFTRNPVAKTYIYPNNPCAFNYYSMLSYVIEVYTKVRPRVRMYTKGVYFDIEDGFTLRFDTLKDLVNYIKYNPQVVTLNA